jgi:nitrogen-specific signal transduction histidine kinase
MSLFKDILDNSEESVIIVNKNNYLEYVNYRFLQRFHVNIVNCVTDRMHKLDFEKR